MWLNLVAVWAVVMTTCTASFCSSRSPYNRNHGYALIGHVIKNLTLFAADCMLACETTLSCFSINSYKDRQGGFMCDLNRSNKKQSPESFVPKTGYEYAEKTHQKYCAGTNCTEKDALQENWFKLGSTHYKLVKEYKTRNDSRQHCQAIGGDLVKITSEIENRFVFEAMPVPELKLDVLARWKLDEYNPTLRYSASAIHGWKEAVGYTLKLDGQSHVGVPRFDIHSTSFTFSIWIYVETTASNMSMLEDYDGYQDSCFRFTLLQGNASSVLFTATNHQPMVYNSHSAVPTNTWVHIAFTWERMSRVGKFYYDGVLIRTSTATTTDPDRNLHETTHPYFYIGKDFSGWMRDLTVVSRVLLPNEIISVKDDSRRGGAWVGLNDITTEGTTRWADGSPLTYQNSQANSDNTDERDCVVMTKGVSNEIIWKAESCANEALFICEKN